MPEDEVAQRMKQPNGRSILNKTELIAKVAEEANMTKDTEVREQFH